MKLRYYVIYFLLVVMMVVATGITVFLLFQAYRASVNPYRNEEYCSFSTRPLLGLKPSRVFWQTGAFIVRPLLRLKPSRFIGIQWPFWGLPHSRIFYKHGLTPCFLRARTAA